LDPADGDKIFEGNEEVGTYTAVAHVLVGISIGNLGRADNLIQESVGQFGG
jgi:hypothetical protein